MSARPMTTTEALGTAITLLENTYGPNPRPPREVMEDFHRLKATPLVPDMDEERWHEYALAAVRGYAQSGMSVISVVQGAKAVADAMAGKGIRSE